MVSALHGSRDFAEAELRAREVFVDFQADSECSSEKLEKYISANRVLAKGLNALRQQNELLKERLAESEARAGKAEQTSNVLRWHIENNNNPSSIHNSGLDIF